jgi:hypothetical protein
LIVYIPDAEPRTVDGAVSPLDIVPTIADLAGIDVSHLTFEGESLVPQLLYGRDAKDRVVFAETNWPDPLRAAIAWDYKLIYNLKANVYQLYDLTADPWEKKNVWGSRPEAGQRLKAVLDEWLERVYFSRDPANQAQEARAKLLLSARPSPKFPLSTELGPLDLLGWDAVGEARAGTPLTVDLYFHARGPTPTAYRFEVEVRGKEVPEKLRIGAKPAALGAVKEEVSPADGLFPTSRWSAGDLVRLSVSPKIPAAWAARQIELTLRVTDEKRAAVGSVPLGALRLAK